jgi:far upstream element-binding protein
MAGPLDFLNDPVMLAVTVIGALIVMLVIMKSGGGGSSDGGDLLKDEGPKKKSKAQLKKEATAAAEIKADKDASAAAKKKAKKAAQKGKKAAASTVVGMLDSDDEEDKPKKGKEKKGKKNSGGAAKPKQAPKPKKSKLAPVELKQEEIDDGWAVAGDPVAKTEPVRAKAPSAAAKKRMTAESLVPSAGGDITMTIDGRKLGLIIGPAGATIKQLQATTGASLQLPDRKGGAEGEEPERETGPCTLTLSGEKDQIIALKKAITELCSKGYSTATEGENFSEAAIQCKSDQLFELIGPGGSVIKALQAQLGVRINTPDTKDDRSLRDNPTNLRVGIAGVKENVAKAKVVMKEILRFHHHEITHPGIVHKEVPDVYTSQYSILIGPKGSTIKQIQSTNNVKLYIPNAESYVQNVMVVGDGGSCSRAIKHIAKILDNAAARDQAREEAANARWEASANDEWGQEEEGYEGWMDEYAPPPKSAGWS